MKKTLPHLFMLILITCFLWAPHIAPVQAQPPGYGGDSNLFILLEINNQSVVGDAAPIEILTSPNVTLFVEAANDLYLESMTFHLIYMGFPVLTQTQPINAPFLAGQNTTSSFPLDLSTFLDTGGLGMLGGSLTGIFEFNYTQGTNTTAVSESFVLLLGPQGTASIFTIPGLITVGFTAMSVFSLLLALDEFQRGIFAARKMRGATRGSDVGIFPTAVVLRRKPKKKKDSETVSKDELVQRVGAAAKKSWDGKRCPKCGKKWKSEEPSCTKCKISRDEAVTHFTEDIAKYAPKAMQVVKPKSKVPVGKFSKRLKLKPDKGGALAAALTDMNIFQTKSVKVPLKKVAFSGMTLAGSYFSWLQIFGGATPGLIDILLMTAGGLVVSVLVGYFMNWLARVPKLGYDK
ncbi:MAG: hypothetical protein RTU92_12590 [Candidatus Thorarchaeota archaeon]